MSLISRREICTAPMLKSTGRSHSINPDPSSVGAMTDSDSSEGKGAVSPACPFKSRTKCPPTTGFSENLYKVLIPEQECLQTGSCAGTGAGLPVRVLLSGSFPSRRDLGLCPPPPRCARQLHLTAFKESLHNRDRKAFKRAPKNHVR